MITVVCVPDNRVLVDDYLSSDKGAALRTVIRQATYQELFQHQRGDNGTWIFTGHDRLGDRGREAACAAASVLVAGGARVLNHPARLLLRYELLTRLYRDGLNRFRPARLDDLIGLRYPVFLREANQHTGSLSPLLSDEVALRRQVEALRRTGYRSDDLIAVEFLDTAVAGQYRKYSAFCVAGTVLPRHAQVSDAWMVKSGSREISDRVATEENRYLLENPHAAQLAPVLALAGIDYGRVDYALVDGTVQVWEINTAPTIGRSRHPPRHPDALARTQVLVAEGRAAFWTGCEMALRTQDQPVTRVYDLELPATLVLAAQRELARAAGAARRHVLMQRAAHVPVVGPAIAGMVPTARRLVRWWSDGRT